MAARPETNALEPELRTRRVKVFRENETGEESENNTGEEIEYIEVQYYTNDENASGTTLVIQIPAYIYEPIEETASGSRNSQPATPSTSIDNTGPTLQLSGSNNLMLSIASYSNSPVVSESSIATHNTLEPKVHVSNNNDKTSSGEKVDAIPGPSNTMRYKTKPSNEIINQLGFGDQLSTMPESGHTKQRPNEQGSNNLMYSQPGCSKQAPVKPNLDALMHDKPGTSRQTLNEPGCSKQDALPRTINYDEPSTSMQAPMPGPSHAKRPKLSSQERRHRDPRMPVTADYDPTTDGPIESRPRPTRPDPMTDGPIESRPRPTRPDPMTDGPIESRPRPTRPDPMDTTEPIEPEPERRTRVTYCFCRKQGDLDRFARAKRKREEMLARRPPPPPRFILTCRGYEHGVEAIISSCINSFEDRISSDLRTFVVAERLYTVLDKSVAAIIFGISRYQKMLRKRKFTLVTDQPIFVKIFNRATLHQTVPHKWKRVATALSLFDYDIIYKPRPPKRNYVRPFLPFYFN